MVFYLQRECNSETAIPGNSIVKFDTPIALSKSGSSVPAEDFQYQSDGSIDIVRPGTYAVFWHVTGMTGFAADGQSYGLKKLAYDASTPDWALLAGTSDHIKNSSAPGGCIVIVSEEEISRHGKATVALFNTADAAIQLTPFSPKAGILIFGLDLHSIESTISGIDREIINLFQQLQDIEEFVHLSDVTEIWSLLPALSGLGAAVITSGYTYNFWGIGTLNHQQTLNMGERYYLIESDRYLPLTHYQGNSTISTLWIETLGPSPAIYSLPIRFDASGIYFTPDATYSNLPAGTTFKFTQALILVSPDP